MEKRKAVADVLLDSGDRIYFEVEPKEILEHRRNISIFEDGVRNFVLQEMINEIRDKKRVPIQWPLGEGQQKVYYCDIPFVMLTLENTKTVSYIVHSIPSNLVPGDVKPFI